MSHPSSHFDDRARDWDQRPMSQQLHGVAQRLLSALPWPADGHVLDFGCGTGLLATAIAPHVATVTALDTSTNMLQVLREKQVPNIRTVQQDLLQTPLPWKFDAIVSCMALHHVADTAGLLRTFAAHMAPTGHLALIDLYAEDGSFHGDNVAKGVHHLGFDPQALQALALAAGFTGVALREISQLHRAQRHYPLFLLTGQRPG